MLFLVCIGKTGLSHDIFFLHFLHFQSHLRYVLRMEVCTGETIIPQKVVFLAVNLLAVWRWSNIVLYGNTLCTTTRMQKGSLIACRLKPSQRYTTPVFVTETILLSDNRGMVS